MKTALIEKQLTKTYRSLWELSRHEKIDSDFLDRLQEKIREARSQWKSESDPLEEKLSQYSKPGAWAQEKIRELAKVIYENKSPDPSTAGKMVSVEIECFFRSKAKETQFVAFVRKHGFSKVVTIKDDGSLHADETCECEPTYDSDGEREECGCDSSSARPGYGKEIVITFAYGDWNFVKMICDKLNELRCYVNKTCGLHVHFDCRHLSSRQTSTLGNRLARAVPALKEILPPSRRENRFCARDINTHADSPSRSRGSDSRYSFVNLEAYSRHKTLEVRGHSGTTDPEKIINWIRLMRAIMDRRNTSRVTTASQLGNVFKLENDLAEYVNRRYHKFASTRSEDGVDDISDDNEALATVNLTSMLQRVNEAIDQAIEVTEEDVA